VNLIPLRLSDKIKIIILFTTNIKCDIICKNKEIVVQSKVVIKPWLSVEKMFKWLQKAPDQGSYQRRMAVWLSFTGKLDAVKIAETLGVSTQAVWLWIRQYNDNGPAGLNRKGRGGRRWSFLTVQQEAELLKPLLRKAKSGSIPKTSQIKQIIEKKLGREVSSPYVYRLLRRHRWFDTIAASKPITSSVTSDTFAKLSRPWLRQI
jgi:transposase